MNQYRVAIEHWDWSHRRKVRKWLTENFGDNSDRWFEETDFNFENLVMDEDVYLIYKLKW